MGLEAPSGPIVSNIRPRMYENIVHDLSHPWSVACGLNTRVYLTFKERFFVKGIQCVLNELEPT